MLMMPCNTLALFAAIAVRHCCDCRRIGSRQLIDWLAVAQTRPLARSLAQWPPSARSRFPAPTFCFRHPSSVGSAENGNSERIRFAPGSVMLCPRSQVKPGPSREFPRGRQGRRCSACQCRGEPHPGCRGFPTRCPSSMHHLPHPGFE